MGELLRKFNINEIEHFKKCWTIQRWVNKREIFDTVLKFRIEGENLEIMQCGTHYGDK